ncbi:MAG TPA: serine/threonine-protein kinase [Polyangiaceae bacterium]|nr:serine/threonine-protein kinase [Polyangiaceae bacterium]
MAPARGFATLAAAMEVLNPGQIFAGRYRVLRRLAEGGMGAVYVAQQQATELDVALKVLWPHILQRKEAVERFALEAKISARIRSDHIVQVFDAGFDQETNMPFLVMELLRGATLQNLVEQRGALPPAEVIELISQTARGLDRAHAYQDAEGRSAPVIHRDLKPDNLFVVRRDTGEPLVKILDYGIAKILSQSTSLSREIKGTPLYMAYEQAVGQPLSPQTDLWALGLITYFALTGENYWRSARSQDSELHTLITEIVAMPLIPASERLAEHSQRASLLPPQFDAWFQRCVNREAKARFASAGEAAVRLAEIFSGAVPLVRSKADSGAFDATLAPNSVHAAAAQSASLAAASQSASFQPSAATGETTMSPAFLTPPPDSRKKSALPYIAGVLGVLTLGALIAMQMKGRTDEPPAAAAAVAEPKPVAPPTPAAAPAVLTGSLQIEPVNATVTINGLSAELVDGKVQIKGAAGTVFNVDVTAEGNHISHEVKLQADGSVEPAKLVLAIPVPHATVAAAEAAAAAAAAAKQSATLRLHATAKPMAKPVATSTKPAVAVATAKPAATATPAAAAPRPAPKYDPLAGPRVH